MNKESNTDKPLEFDDDTDMLDEYDFSKGVRGKHYLPHLNQDKQSVEIKIQSEGGERLITQKIVEVRASISPDGILTAKVPADILPGNYRVVLRIEQPANSN